MSTGATPKVWGHFDLILGLTEDLLPVVSNPNVPISPNSKMKGLGKTPSIVNGQGFAIGFSNWTQHLSTASEIKKWATNPNYGICLQTRHIRAIDVDVTDPAQAEAISELIGKRLGNLPMRYRSNASKVLFLIEMPGDFSKRAFTTEHGIVEFLATGQQCIVYGQHTSGVPYEWSGGLPSNIPTIQPEQFNALWDELITTYATEKASTLSAPIKHEVLKNALSNDPIAVHLGLKGLVKSTERDGRLHIECPFASEHSGPSSDSATTYFPANTGGFAQGHFDCKHAHCAERTDDEFASAIGYVDITFDDFTSEVASASAPATDSARFAPIQIGQFADGPEPEWIIKDLIPEAELVVIYGPSGSGKSFAAFDMAASIAQGIHWKDLRTKKGPVIYIAAEGAGGMRKRARAYEMTNGIDLNQIDMHIIAGTPNFLLKQDALDVAAGSVHLKPSVVIVDTWAQVTAGGNENSGEDMGLALKHCKGIHKATGATIILIHHSGKNVAMGARGWSGLRAAADAEIEVEDNDGARVIRSTKQKDAETGMAYGFKLNVVPLGLDKYGDTVTSCVIEHTDVVSSRPSKESMGKFEAAVMGAADELVGLDGMLPDENSVVDLAVSKMPMEEGKRDRRRERVARAITGLVEKRVILRVDGRIEIA